MSITSPSSDRTAVVHYRCGDGSVDSHQSGEQESMNCTMTNSGKSSLIMSCFCVYIAKTP